MAKKSSCPITRPEFREHAKALIVKIGEREYKAVPKEFSTGSLGWYLNNKVTVKVGDKTVTVQVGMNMTIVGSKELPKDGATANGAAAD